MAPEAIDESLDPRDPLLRLSRFFDDGSIELLHERDRSGVLAAGGTVNGVRTIAFCHRRHRDGRRDGARGLHPHRQRLRHRHRGAEPDRGHLALRRRAAGRGREGAARGRVGVRGDDPGVRLHPADLGGGRFRRRRCRLRAGADRRRHHGAGGPGVRHRARRGAQRHRRRRRHGLARRPGHPPQEVRRVPHRRRRRSSTPTSAAAGWSDCSASRGISTAARPRRTRPTCTRCCRIRRGGPTTCTRWSTATRSTTTHRFDEFQAKWAPSMVVGLGRLSGRSVGVLANNPLRLGGCLNSESAEKAARFVRLCDAFGIPLIVIVDVPGYLPGCGPGVGRRRAPRRQAAARVR